MSSPINAMIDAVCICNICGKPMSAKCGCWDKVPRKCSFRGCRRKATVKGHVPEVSDSDLFRACEKHRHESDFVIVSELP